VIATRLYNQPMEKGVGKLYKGAVDCLVKSVQAEGIMALYKGFLPHYFRLAPHTILTLVFWEQYKALAQR
jgi:solute carrier family 25 protein 34/35